MEKIDIAVVDYGMGNLKSVSKAIEHIAPGKVVQVTSTPEQIHAAERVVFPGQGAMPECIQELDARGLHGAVMNAAKTKPFLGICIGLQMLFDHSEEGDVKGLGLLSGNVKKFTLNGRQDDSGEKLKVPHMGWNQVYQKSKPHIMWQNIANGERFYFVHSYYVMPKDDGAVEGFSEYPTRFTCAVANENIFAVQFHPEKSAHAGLQLLRNFVNWKP
ncbi:MAG TPA: imidazole glycerol phosphate synthase subunit HisH [Methylophilaceae bacterium]|nr:imidazole glycerol phosphate synthase subunit HisH [Methylophilaceae bacterium]